MSEPNQTPLSLSDLRERLEVQFASVSHWQRELAIATADEFSAGTAEQCAEMLQRAAVALSVTALLIKGAIR